MHQSLCERSSFLLFVFGLEFDHHGRSHFGMLCTNEEHEKVASWRGYSLFIFLQYMHALVEETFQAFVFGWYKIVFIHRNYKFNKSVQETEKQYAYLSVTFRQHDNYTDVYDGKLANCCQKVRGKKANQRANSNMTKN